MTEPAPLSIKHRDFVFKAVLASSSPSDLVVTVDKMVVHNISEFTITDKRTCEIDYESSAAICVDRDALNEAGISNDGVGVIKMKDRNELAFFKIGVYPYELYKAVQFSQLSSIIPNVTQVRDYIKVSTEKGSRGMMIMEKHAYTLTSFANEVLVKVDSDTCINIVKSMMCQLICSLYSLTCYLMISHGDFHIGNIMVDVKDVTNNYKITYMIGTHKVEVPACFILNNVKKVVLIKFIDVGDMYDLPSQPRSASSVAAHTNLLNMTKNMLNLIDVAMDGGLDVNTLGCQFNGLCPMMELVFKAPSMLLSYFIRLMPNLYSSINKLPNLHSKAAAYHEIYKKYSNVEAIIRGTMSKVYSSYTKLSSVSDEVNKLAPDPTWILNSRFKSVNDCMTYLVDIASKINDDKCEKDVKSAQSQVNELLKEAKRDHRMDVLEAVDAILSTTYAATYVTKKGGAKKHRVAPRRVFNITINVCVPGQAPSPVKDCAPCRRKPRGLKK